MKTWYKAVCDEHKEMIDIFVTNVVITSLYLADKNDSINSWLSKHYGCNLRLIHNDSDLDECFNNKYSVIKK